VTINLKDFKAVLGLCEALGAHLKLCFDSPGSPLVAEPLFPHAHGQARRTSYFHSFFLSFFFFLLLVFSFFLFLFRLEQVHG
jgi:hypothetical protein